MKAAIVTISDGCYHQKKKDTSGQALAQLLVDSQWTVAFMTPSGSTSRGQA